MDAQYFGKLTWQQVGRLRGKTAILPLGALEEHGPHLPLSTDTIVPMELARRVSAKTGALILPPVEYGYVFTLRGFPGTLSLRHSTYAALITDIVSECVRHGFGKILILNGHGGNAAIVKHALNELSLTLNFRACMVSWWEIKELALNAGHADETEASVLLACLPNYPLKKPRQLSANFYFGSVFPRPKDAVFTKLGYAGSVKNISRARGKEILDAAEKKLVKLVKSNLLLKE